MTTKELTREEHIEQFGIERPLTKLELDEFKKKLPSELSLPPEFDEFILKYNGGSFIESFFITEKFGPVIVSEFFPLENDDPASIAQMYFNYFADESDETTLPFAGDPGGNAFMIGIHENNKGCVFFWDHEENTQHKICESFELFINSLSVQV